MAYLKAKINTTIVFLLMTKRYLPIFVPQSLGITCIKAQNCLVFHPITVLNCLPKHFKQFCTPNIKKMKCVIFIMSVADQLPVTCCNVFYSAAQR